jgi:hypothetical protein
MTAEDDMWLRGRIGATGAIRHVGTSRAPQLRTGSVIVAAALFVLSVVPVAVSSNAGAAATKSGASHPTRVHASGPTSLVVPLYDSYGADWSSTCATLASSNSFVVADVSSPSGPGTFADPDWAADFGVCESAHVGVLGYVDSDYCQTPIATVESQVDSWYHWYASVGVDGIFIDEVASPSVTTSKSDCLSGTLSALSYYQTVAAYVHAEGVSQTVTFNYGANPNSAWALSSRIAAQNANILVIFDSPYSQYVNYANSGRPWSTVAWESTYSPSHFAVLVYDAPNVKLPGAFCSQASQQNVGFVYATPNGDWTTPAPVSYLQGELNNC